MFISTVLKKEGNKNLIDEKFVFSLNKGDVAILCANGWDINESDYNGNTVLHFACEGNPKIVPYLIEKGAGKSIQSKCKEGIFAFEYLLDNFKEDKKTHLKAIKSMLEHGVKINDLNNNKNMVFQKLVQNNDIELLKIIKPYMDFNTQDIEGNTILHYLIQDKYLIEENEINVLLFFLNNGADPSIKNKEGNDVLMSFLFEATEISSEDIKNIDKIIKIIQIFEENNIDLNAINNFGFNSVLIASYGLNEKIVLHLIKKGSDVNTINHFGHNLLMSSCEKQDVNIINQIIPITNNINQQDEDGNTALHLLLEFVDEDGDELYNNQVISCAKNLIEAGLDYTIKNYDNKTALGCAKKISHKAELEKYLMNIDHSKKMAIKKKML